MKVVFLKIAEAELDDAFEYYESVQSSLGFRFLTEIELSNTRIQQFPLSYEKIGKYSRRCLVQKISLWHNLSVCGTHKRNLSCGCFPFTSSPRLLVR